MIDYIVIDDESHPRELLIYSIDNLGLDFRLVGEANNLNDGVKLITSLKPQVVFLDIQMPGNNGLKIREFLKDENANFKLIFVTAYDQYAIQAIRLAAFDYLLKPVELNYLKECLTKIIQDKNKSNQTYKQLKSLNDTNVLVIKSHQGTNFIHINDIVYITADGMYSSFVLHNKIITASKPLKFYENIHKNLFRCHRSYIVNIDFIDKIDGQFIKLKSVKKIPISRNKKDALIENIKLSK